MKPRLFFLICFCLFFLGNPVFANENTAKDIYSRYAPALYQIQIIDLASGKKSSIGSGFQFTADGYLASNYHVVASAVQHPDQYRIEFLQDDGTRGALKIIAADVVQDLSILKKVENKSEVHIELGTADLDKGSRLYSLGNPHDIGFTIIEGTYNGVSEKKLNKRIHFSGSLNPGMSGGPALDAKGRVIGVNVSTAGNQISFLIPVEYLKSLIARFKEDQNGDFKSQTDKIVGNQLFENQKRYVGKFLQGEWEKVPLGNFVVPGKVSDVFKCWGGTDNDNKEYNFVYSQCSSEDDIYIDQNLSTGMVVYRYELVSSNILDQWRFNSLYEHFYSRSILASYNGGEKWVTNFKCETDFLELAESKWKTNICTRQYKKYKQIFDVHVYLAQIGIENDGFLVSLVMQGVSKDSAMSFLKKFMTEIEKKPEGKT